MQNRKLAVQRNQAPAEKSGEFRIGGALRVTRLGFGAMRITGGGVWGEPADRLKPSEFCGALWNWESILSTPRTRMVQA